LNPSDDPTNVMEQLETRRLNESTSAIMAALTMKDPASASEFVREILHKILLQRMISPPGTDLLCITLIGNVTAREFASYWQKHLPAEPAMAIFLQKMQAADVVYGSPEGEIIDQVSLLDFPTR
jgi:hypothetical protein